MTCLEEKPYKKTDCIHCVRGKLLGSISASDPQPKEVISLLALLPIQTLQLDFLGWIFGALLGVFIIAVIVIVVIAFFVARFLAANPVILYAIVALLLVGGLVLIITVVGAPIGTLALVAGIFTAVFGLLMPAKKGGR